MTLPLLVRRSLRQHALSTIVTATGIALACGLLMSVWTFKAQAQGAFASTAEGFDAVLGARGSKLQLVLSAIFHLEAAPGRVTKADYERIKAHPAVTAAIPIAMGDSFRGYRIVGTLPELFTDVEYAPGRKLTVAPGGRLFSPGTDEAVVGSFAASRLGLKPGDHFHPFHGLTAGEEQAHEEEFTVTGVLEPSNTPADRVIWIPIEGVQTMEGHDPAAASDLSAVLVRIGSPMAALQLDRQYNLQDSRLTFAWPVASIVAELFGRISWFDRVLAMVAYLVALVASGSVLASIYNSMSARRRDLAILRALGARRRTIFGAVVTEAACIGALGGIAGLAIHLLLFNFAAGIVRAQTGVVLDPFEGHPVLWIAPLAMIGLCAAGGIVPAIKAYRTPVAENLVPLS